MARLFTSASSEYLERTSAVITAYPFTMACWGRPAALNPALTGMSITTSGSDNNYWALDMTASATIRFRARDGASSTDTITTATIGSANTWNHMCAVGAAANDKRVFLNGANKITNSTSRTPSAGGLNRTSIGRKATSTGLQYFNGRIAEAAIWNIALSDNDVLMLGLGVSPLMVRPDALVAYWPILGIGSSEPEFIGRNELTATGTAQADHPNIFYRAIPIYSPRATAGGTSVTVTPSELTGAFSVQDPTIITDQVLSITELSGLLSLQDPATLYDWVESITEFSLTGAVEAPSIVTDAVCSITELPAALSTQDPTVNLDYAIPLSELSGTLSIQDPSATGGATTTITELTLTASSQDPTVNLDYVIAVSELSGSLAVQDPSVTGEAIISPSELTGTFSIQAPTIDLSGGAVNITVEPNSVDGTFSIQAPIVTGDALFTATELSLTSSVQAPTVFYDFSVSLSEISLAGSVIAPTVLLDAVIAPAVIDLTLSVQASTASGSALIDVEVFNLGVEVQAPNVRADQVLQVAVLSAAFTIIQPAVDTGQIGKIIATGNKCGFRFEGADRAFVVKGTKKNFIFRG